MGRPRMTKDSKKLHIGGIYEVQLVSNFDYLCTKLGVSKQEALRRLVIQAIRAQEIPGIVPFEFSMEENAMAPFAHTKPKPEASSDDTKVLYE